MDREKVERAVRMILEAIGEDPEREGLVGTPKRVAAMFAQVFSGLQQDPGSILTVEFNEEHEEMVLVKDVPFYSMCEHHLLPFSGRAHVAYIPRGKVVGISKLARVVELFARRPQLQERLTSQIADTIMQRLSPRAVAVIIEAEHTCMAMRGVQKPGSSIVTSAMRGTFRTHEAQRLEFLSLIQG